MLIPSLLLASAAFVVAQSPTTTLPSTPSSLTEPCAQISATIASGVGKLLAQTAYDCLNSVPVDVEGDSKLIDELKIIWQWHSEVGWLKNTPDTWENGPIDLEGELDKIKASLNQYPSEYAVQLAIWALTIRTGNFHFNYQPDILQIFSWTRPVGVVSLSDDGKQLPRIFLSNDVVLLNEAENSANLQIAPITQINGQEVHSYLEKVAAREQYISLDGRLNSVHFRGLADSSVGSFMLQTQYDGGITNITFANNTQRSWNNTASTSQTFEGVVDGESFFNAYCKGAISGFSTNNAKAKRGHLNAPVQIPSSYHLGKRQSIPTNYPTAVVEAKSKAVAGYFLNAPGYEDVAVLKIITFDPTGDNSGSEFQAAVDKFLAACISSKKKKLIIDLRENGGGATNLLLDTFMQLFPKEIPFSGQRYRAQEQFALIGDSVSEIYNDKALLKAYEDYTQENLEDRYRYWAYWRFTTAEYKNWKDWLEFFGPNEFNNDLFTTLMRYNYSNSDPTSIRPSGFYFSNVTNSPLAFEPSNVVMFTDALCGSSCASFHEELKNIAGIKAVVVGGRAANEPMETVAGTKGGEVIPLYNFPQYGKKMIDATNHIGATSLENTAVSELAGVKKVYVRVGDGSTRIQTQDQIRKGDTSGTPLQYIYEAADCKIFYTQDTLFDPSLAWQAVWDAFTDDSKCVEGSTKDPSSISGGYHPFGPGPLNSKELPQPNGTASATISHIPGGTGSAMPYPARSANGTVTVSGGPSTFVPAYTSTTTGIVSVFTGAAASASAKKAAFYIMAGLGALL